jgi:hypothetical protein
MNFAMVAIASLFVVGIVLLTGRGKLVLRGLCFLGAAAALLLLARSSPANCIGIIGGFSVTPLAVMMSRFD